MESKKVKGILATVAWFIVMLGVILGIRYFFPLVEVNGPSMNNTLFDGQELVTERKFSKLNYGDIVIAHNKNYNNNKKKLVKRVIGKSGDKIRIANNHVYRNDKQLKEPYIKEPMVDSLNSFYGGAFYDSDALSSPDGEDVAFETVVPKGKVFIMGDNRNISGDSRMYGFFSVKSDIYSKVIIKLPFKAGTLNIILWSICGVLILILIFESKDEVKDDSIDDDIKIEDDGKKTESK